MIRWHWDREKLWKNCEEDEIWGIVFTCPEDLLSILLYSVWHPKRVTSIYLIRGILSLWFLVELNYQETGGQAKRDLDFISPGCLPAGLCVGNGSASLCVWWSFPTATTMAMITLSLGNCSLAGKGMPRGGNSASLLLALWCFTMHCHFLLNLLIFANSQHMNHTSFIPVCPLLGLCHMLKRKEL